MDEIGGTASLLEWERQFVGGLLAFLCSLSTLRVRISTVALRIGPTSDAADARNALTGAAMAPLNRGTSSAVRRRMRRALMNLLPSLVMFAPSLFLVAITILAIANNLPGLARVRIPHAG